MSKRMKICLSLFLCIAVLFGSNVFVSYAQPSDSKNISEKCIVTSRFITVQGIVKGNEASSKPVDDSLILETSDGKYFIKGKTKALAKHLNYEVKIKGWLANHSENDEVKTIRVTKFKIISESEVTSLPTPTQQPTPTPQNYSEEFSLLQGTLKKGVDSGAEFELETDKGVYALIGTISGIEKYLNLKIEVKGHHVVTLVPQNPPLFNVVGFRPVAEAPLTEILDGVLTSVLDKDKKIYELKCDKALVALTGKTEGMDKYIGRTVTVKGSFLKMILPEFPGHAVFEVGAFAPINQPTPTPADYNIHVITSDKPLYFKNPSLSTNLDKVRGNLSISWNEKSNQAFFNAKVKIAFGIEYEFRLIETKACSEDSIEGLFDIMKDGKAVASGITGKLYGLNQPVGEYFKFYSSDEQWHLSGYITYRMDY